MSFFKDNLEKLEFNVSSSDDRSLLLVSQLNDESLTATEVFALEQAKNEFKATAVYFRHFPDGRAPIPQIYLYDNTNDLLTDNDLANIHRDLWSNCRIPMFIVIEKSEVKIFDTREPVEVSGGDIKTTPIDSIKITDNLIKLYSKKLFDSGIFWESEKAKGRFLEITSAYRDLVDNLKIVRKDFLKAANLPSKTANKLLVFSILIKYLEERGNQGDRLFAKDFFQRFGAQDFCDVLSQKGKIVALFDELSRLFNGKIFEWADAEERLLVENADLTQLALFLYGDIKLETGQYYFWRKYSFNHLPVELISSVYEELLNERRDAVYTPAFLVNTLIDESMPQKNFEDLSVKTIDVSCGSGIFLVSAFKRLAQRHRYAEFKRTGELKSLNSKKLLQIIKNNIFGVDIEEEAVRLTVFSLCLALCDELTPKEIWTDLKFDDTFQTNFKTLNFFSYLNQDNLNTFDLVIGNAPFIELTVKKNKNGIYFYKDSLGNEIELNEEVSKRIDKGKKNKKPAFPQNQIALMFLDQAPRLLKENGFLCLIMPSAPLLYNNSVEFRKHFFSRYQVLQILDFTNLDTILFGTARVPAATVFARNQECNAEKPITHITVRRTRSLEQKIFFEIDKYDFHYVSQENALDSKHIWKSNLLGGGRLNNLIYRLSEITSIDKFVQSNNWVVGEGYIIGSRKPILAPHITGKPSLSTKAFTKRGVDISKIKPEPTELFEGPRTEALFTPPLLVIKENIGIDRIPTYFSDTYLPFTQKMVGIAVPKEDRERLLSLNESFEKNNEIYKLFITATSNEYLVKRATAITKQDIMNLPYSENKEELNLSFVEQIICDDVLNFQTEMLAKGSEATANQQKATKIDLENFGEVFNKLLNSIYGKSGKEFYFKKIYNWGEFFITEFNYGTITNKVEFEEVDSPSASIESLIQSEYGTSAFLVKVLKLYERNKIYLVKPKALRYWLRSIAIKDADEVFSDSIKAGY